MIYPAIDLMDGGCVRLLKGDFNKRTNYDISPLEMAKQFKRQGAKWIHIVDLDGAKSETSQQTDLIIEIANTCGLNVQTGGGLRSLPQVQSLLDGGVARVVIGSLAISNPSLIKGWMSKLGPEKFTLAFDVQIDNIGIPRPAIRGWQDVSSLSLWQIIDEYLHAGLKTILVTDIAKDGALQGANTALYKDIVAKHSSLELITSGGVGTLEDVKALKVLNPAGIIIGKALYENKFTLADAITC